MANPNYISDGQGERVDTLVDASGTGYFKAAGDGIAVTGASSQAAPALVQQIRPGTATRTAIVAAITDTQLIAANAVRKGCIVYNDSTAILYLALGTTTVTTTNYTLQVAGQGYYEVPYYYTGMIRGIWASASGTAYITELT